MSETLPILPLHESVLFPDSLTPIGVSTPSGVALVEAAARGDDRIVTVAVKRDDAGDDPGAKDVYRVGTEAIIHRIVRVPDGTLRVLVQGIERVKIGRFVGGAEYLRARVSALPDSNTLEDTELEALRGRAEHLIARLVDEAEVLPDELKVVATNVDTPGELCHFAVSALRIGRADQQQVLEAHDVRERLRIVIGLLAHQLELATLGAKIQSEVHEEMDRSQREYVLRQQLKAIREELGETESFEEISELRETLAKLALPDEVRTAADRELGRLSRTPEQSAEHGVIRNYLEWIAALPWCVYSTDSIDLTVARATLDADHYGLEQVKERILDHLAVAQITGGAGLNGPILCFVGPPGVGKTSLGASIARTLGRKFARISVGGVRDEAEIRGHRRTYVGSMPGSITRALRDAQTANPVFVIDELDKMGADFRGDPASAMLEVLDPAQNASFRDHYLDVPFDLSHVLFICTANRTDTIPPALRDRMEIIEVEGYTEVEKLAIAERYLVPRQLAAHGLKKSRVALSKATLRAVIERYTREAGVRELDRQIATLARKAARELAEHPKTKRVTLAADRLKDLLGPAKFERESKRRTQYPGVATGLAVTGAGGEILYIETTAMPGRGKLTITGQVGDVMEESVRAAMSWLRSSHSADADASAWFAKHDLHVHIPAGAIPKDGPSAGIAIATALTSLVRDIPVRADLAMTGEITLTGEVLPIGGLKGKALAAQRAGIHHVIAPERNRVDLDTMPDTLLKGVEFHFVDHISQVLELALPAQKATGRGRSTHPGSKPSRATDSGRSRPRARTPKAIPAQNPR